MRRRAFLRVLATAIALPSLAHEGREPALAYAHANEGAGLLEAPILDGVPQHGVIEAQAGRDGWVRRYVSGRPHLTEVVRGFVEPIRFSASVPPWMREELLAMWGAA